MAGLIPPFLRRPDPSHEEYVVAARRQYRARIHCSEKLNEGTIYEEPLTVELAMHYFERIAAEALA